MTARRSPLAARRSPFLPIALVGAPQGAAALGGYGGISCSACAQGEVRQTSLSARVGLAHRIRNARSRDQSSTLTSVHTDGKHSDSGHGSRWNRRDSAELRGAFAYALPYRRGLGAISKRRENGVRLA
jgi:hypothetical protein